MTKAFITEDPMQQQTCASALQHHHTDVISWRCEILLLCCDCTIAASLEVIWYGISAYSLYWF